MMVRFGYSGTLFLFDMTIITVTLGLFWRTVRSIPFFETVVI